MAWWLGSERMWLKNDILEVFFDERRGGMPVRDSFGFIRAASVEIDYTGKFPHFQSLNDKKPHIERHGDSKLVASGIIQKKGKRATPHTYEMVATLEQNRLNLAYKLNAARTEEVVVSKIWLWTNPGVLQKCMMSGNIMDKDIGIHPRWDLLYDGEPSKTPITLFGPGGKLEVTGSITPPIYMRVWRFKKYPKLEVAHGWARGLLQEGTYSGDLTLTYMRE